MATALAVASAGTAVALTFGTPAAAAPVGQPAANQRAAETAALRQAAESGSNVEVSNSRSETARVLATPRGTLVRESYAVPHWTKKDGDWRQIDLKLRKDGNSIAPAASVADVRFSAGGTEPLVTLNGAGGALKLTWPSKLPAPRIEGDVAVYESVLPDIDLQVQSTVEGFGYSLVVKTRQAAANPALKKLKFGLSSTGWTLKQRPGGGYETRDKTGKTTASAGPALMWDSTGAPAAQRSLTAGKSSVLRHVPDESRKASLPTTVENGSLVIVPDAAMLADPNVAFPVVIDPWTGVGRSRWGYTNSTDANRDDGIVRVGLNTDGSGTFRSFFAFDLTWLPGKQIRNAKFITTMTHSWDCNATPVSLYRTADLPSSGKQTWSGPALNLFVETKSGHAHKPSTGAGCNNDPQPNMYMEFSNPTLVNDVINFGQGRGFYTLGLSARDSDGTDEAAGNRWKKFDQASTAMSIEYNTLPNTPQATALTTHPDFTAAGQPCVTGTGRPNIRTTTPSLQASISDPDGDQSGQLSASFALQQWNGTAWAAVAGWPKSDTGIPSGTIGEVGVAQGALTGSMARWQVQVSDGLGGTSGWSPWCEFTLDTTPPGIKPTVTAADGLYLESPPNDTLRGTVGRSGQFTLGANGETDIVDYEYQVEGGPKMYATATITGGPATIWATPTHAGENVLTVRSRDAGQNASPPKDYRFLVAAPTGPKATWKLDEGTGTALSTSPAGGPALTAANGPAWTDGRVPGTHQTAGTDRGLRFDGVDDHAASAATVLDTSKSFGVAAWVRPTGGLDTARTVLCQEGAANCGFALSYTPAPVNRWTLTTYGSDTANAPPARTTSGAPPVLNQWTHLAASWDAGTKTAKLYVNGLLAGQSTRATNWNATGVLLLGRGKVNGSRSGTFLGDIGEAQVWDRALDPELDLKPAAAPVTAGNWDIEDYTTAEPRQVTDESRYQHPLTLSADPTATFCDGYDYSTGLCFDGTSGAATAGAPVRTDQSFTVGGWVRLTDTSISRTAFSQQGSRGAAFAVRYDKAANRWAFTVTGTDTDTPTAVQATSIAAPLVDSWTYLEAVYDAHAGRIRLFVDRRFQSEAAVTAIWNASGAFNLGRTLKAGAATEFFAGGIDEVRVVAGAAQTQTPAGYYQTITPTRFLDTRSGLGTGGSTAPIQPGGTVRLPIAGVNGIPASDVTAVAVNVTVIYPTAPGFLTLYPSNTPQPGTSNLYYETNAVLANFAIVPVGPDGTISIYVGSAGTAHLNLDVSGYFTTDDTKAGNSTYQPLHPSRILDTRTGLGAPLAPLANGGTIAVQVAGVNGVPADITAVAINLTSANATSSGHLITRADGTPLPMTSGLQMTAGGVLADMAIVAVPANGKIDITMSGGLAGSHTDVVGDVIGYFTAGTGGSKYHAVNATRVLDTRQDNAPVVAYGVRSSGCGNVVADDATLILNLTVTQGGSGGFGKSYATGATPPGASTINWYAGQTIAALTLTKTSGGTTDFYSYSDGALHLIVDCLGYFSSN
ncbi:LamG domain-containing protein [Dactylosporangium sp. NBC_01737]|uniref:LamG domain-containing protein n=1 Tax=Dactylosporangium sp. NBC_01737 TaxID=2975959 RepID=UPI002E10EAF8|nr:LamG domain-containing protein [Dactylosporangium sp. NBC_01737]